ncbi:MAG: hydrogenase maturation protease [Bryobacterales bacterium]|nr:hydrogenase maturation protease [Bryobacterales bacterium]
MNKVRIIGCGNLYRGDDAAGILVVHRLREFGVEAHEAGDDMTRLMSAWQPDESVFLVDAALAVAAPGTILRFSPKDLPRATKDLRFSTHGIDLAEFIGLAGALGRLPRELTVIGIVGENFAAGAKVGAAVREAVERVAAELASLAHPEKATDAVASAQA